MRETEGKRAEEKKGKRKREREGEKTQQPEARRLFVSLFSSLLSLSRSRSLSLSQKKLKRLRRPRPESPDWRLLLRAHWPPPRLRLSRARRRRAVLLVRGSRQTRDAAADRRVLRDAARLRRRGLRLRLGHARAGAGKSFFLFPKFFKFSRASKEKRKYRKKREKS